MCHISHHISQMPFSRAFISVKYINPFVCHDINIGHSCLKKLMFQTRYTTMREDQGVERQRRVAMTSFNAPANNHSHIRILRLT